MRLMGKNMRRIHWIEFIQSTAKLTSHFNRAALRNNAFNFVSPQTAQHIGDALA